MSLAARHLEQAGIATVVVGAARDVVEHCGVARFVWSDLPLGNPCGVPFDVAMQRAVVAAALTLLADARAPRTTVATPFRFGPDDDWKASFLRVEAGHPEALAEAGRSRRAAQERQRRTGRARED